MVDFPFQLTECIKLMFSWNFHHNPKISYFSDSGQLRDHSLHGVVGLILDRCLSRLIETKFIAQILNHMRSFLMFLRVGLCFATLNRVIRRFVTWLPFFQGHEQHESWVRSFHRQISFHHKNRPPLPTLRRAVQCLSVLQSLLSHDYKFFLWKTSGLSWKMSLSSYIYILLLKTSKKGHMTNLKMLINTGNINESSPCFSGRELDTSPIRFNKITEKIIVLF